MRRLLVVLGLIASISSAFAQEYETPPLQYEIPTLRGSDSFVPDAPGPLYRPRWSGFYVGGQAGIGSADMNFATSTQDLVAHELRQLTLESVQRVSTWQVLGKAYPSSASYGGFVGYNVGWESIILGFELNYNRTNFFASAPMTTLSINTSAGGNTYNVNLTGSASMRITDVMTLRARAGYEVGNFLPFAMIGVAAGRADLTRSATVSGQQNPTPPPDPNSCDPIATPPCIPFSFTEGDTRSRAFIYGWSLGGGLEVMVMPKVFLRAEYEFIGFAPIWDIKAIVQTARVGVGYKF